MRVLLDENLPHRLRLLFAPNVEAVTVGYLGWQGKRNGDLLRAAEAEGFYADLKPLMPRVNDRLKQFQPGELVRIEE